MVPAYPTTERILWQLIGSAGIMAPPWNPPGAPVSRIFAFVVLLLLAACAREPVLNCDLTQIVRLPVEMRGRLPTVPITLEGQHLRMVVDTGAERTTISEASARRLRMPRDMQHINRATGLGGTVVSPDATVSSFVLGNVRMPIPRVAVGKFGFDDDANPLADGLLGADILLAFDLDIDFPGRALTLYRLRRCVNNQPPWQEPFVPVVGVTSKKDRLLIPFQLDGVPGTAILDTGATATTVGVQLASRMGLNDQTMALDRAIVQRGAGTGSMTSHLHWFKELRVGPAMVQGLMLSVLPTDAGVGDALIGEDFLEGRRIWLSYPTRQVFVSKLAHEIAPR